MSIPAPIHAARLTPKELERIFDVSPRTVAKWMATKRIPFFRIGRVVRFNPDDVVEFIFANTVRSRRAHGAPMRPEEEILMWTRVEALIERVIDKQVLARAPRREMAGPSSRKAIEDGEVTINYANN